MVVVGRSGRGWVGWRDEEGEFEREEVGFEDGAVFGVDSVG